MDCCASTTLLPSLMQLHRYFVALCFTFVMHVYQRVSLPPISPDYVVWASGICDTPIIVDCRVHCIIYHHSWCISNSIYYRCTSHIIMRWLIVELVEWIVVLNAYYLWVLFCNSSMIRISTLLWFWSISIALQVAEFGWRYSGAIGDSTTWKP